MVNIGDIVYFIEGEEIRHGVVQTIRYVVDTGDPSGTGIFLPENIVEKNADEVFEDFAEAELKLKAVQAEKARSLYETAQRKLATIGIALPDLDAVMELVKQ